MHESLGTCIEQKSWNRLKMLQQTNLCPNAITLQGFISHMIDQRFLNIVMTETFASKFIPDSIKPKERPP